MRADEDGDQGADLGQQPGDDDADHPPHAIFEAADAGIQVLERRADAAHLGAELPDGLGDGIEGVAIGGRAHGGRASAFDHGLELV